MDKWPIVRVAVQAALAIALAAALAAMADAGLLERGLADALRDVLRAW